MWQIELGIVCDLGTSFFSVFLVFLWLLVVRWISVVFKCRRDLFFHNLSKFIIHKLVPRQLKKVLFSFNIDHWPKI